jgi:DNA-binding XRE family transcriptional regulator
VNFIERFNSKIKVVVDSCHTWQGSHFKVTGYGAFWLKGQNRGAHRIAWEIVKGKIPRGLHLCHSCDNRGCVNPEHMFLGSHQDNVADMVAKARHAFGERQTNSKLTDAQVLEIRQVYARGGISQTELGKSYGVGHTTISYVVNKRAWRHL